MNRGFTLLEILIALAIFAIAVLAVAQTLQTHVQRAEDFEWRTLGIWAASNEATRIRLSREWPSEDMQRSRVNMAGREMFLQRTAAATADPDLRRVEIQVFRDPAREQSVAQLFTYVGRPGGIPQ
ncbi:MAG: type II secretion system minor pseudopilin GspI [Gammaproteobacteria bacterium]|nr:type II secretion system minor pseudopilin GspI [Gammaproteobacteria bacterium]